jgi:hypothetical protein
MIENYVVIQKVQDCNPSFGCTDPAWSLTPVGFFVGIVTLILIWVYLYRVWYKPKGGEQE